MFEKIQASVFIKKMNSSLNEEFKNLVANDRKLRKRYLDFSLDIDNIISKFGCSDIICSNILLALQKNYMSQLIELFNNSLLSEVVRFNNLSINELFFLSNNKDRIESTDLEIYANLSKLDDDSLNNYFNFSSTIVRKESIPLCFFRNDIYNKIISNKDFNFFEYLNNLMLKYSNSDVMLNKIISLIDNGFDNFCRYVSVKKQVDFNCDFSIFNDEYFNKIGLERLLEIDLSNKSDMNDIVSLMNDDKSGLLDDYLLCKRCNIMITEVVSSTNSIFELILNNSNKKKLLYFKLFGVGEITPMMMQIINGYVSFDMLNSELVAKYEPLIEFIKKINGCSNNNDFEKLDNLIKRNSLNYSEYFLMMEDDLNRNNAQIIADAISSVKQFENDPLRVHVEDGINIIDFDGQPFSMLVHAVYQRSENTVDDTIAKRFNKFDGSISTSLISDKHMHFYKVNQLVFLGYNDIKASQIVSASSKDSGTVNAYRQKNANISLPKQIYDENANSYNEVVINTLDGEQKPNYVLCFNEIDELSKRTAKKYNIPVYLIHTYRYPGASIDGNLLAFQDENTLYNDVLVHDNSNLSL